MTDHTTCMGEPERRPLTLGAAVTKRRERLGLTQEQVEARGRINPTSIVSEIEDGIWEGDPTSPSLTRLDDALAWPPGTCRTIFEGVVNGSGALKLVAAPPLPPSAPPTAPWPGPRVAESAGGLDEDDFGAAAELSHRLWRRERTPAETAVLEALLRWQLTLVSVEDE